MKGCLDCKFYVSSLRYVEDHLNSKSEIIRKCHLGNTQVMNNWWNENGNKVRNKDHFTELPCYETPEEVKMLQDLNGKLDELLEILNKK